MSVDARPAVPAEIADLGHAPRGVPLTAGAVTSAPGVRRRLAELGLRAGARVTVLRRTSGGGAILAVGDSRVAVSRTVLSTIEVIPESVPVVLSADSPTGPLGVADADAEAGSESDSDGASRRDRP